MIDLKTFDPTDANTAIKAAERANRLEALLLESKRRHSGTYLEEENDHDPCPRYYEDHLADAACTCGADAWNARVDELLK